MRLLLAIVVLTAVALTQVNSQGSYQEVLTEDALALVLGASCNEECEGPCSGITCTEDPPKKGQTSDGGNACRATAASKNCTLDPDAVSKVQCRWFSPANCDLATSYKMGKETCDPN